MTSITPPISKPGAATSNGNTNGHRVIRRRNRAKKSCKPCAERHVKCNLIVPCFSCIQRNEQSLCFIDNPSLNKKKERLLNTQHRSASPPEASQRGERYDMAPPNHVVEEYSLPSTSPFIRFLEECGSSLESNASPMSSDRLVRRHSRSYPEHVGKELEHARSSLPKRAADTVQMLRRCMTLSAWVGCSSDAARQVGLYQNGLNCLFDIDEGVGGVSTTFPQGHDTPTSELFPSLCEKGDAARLSLVIAMCLSATSMSSVRLARLAYGNILGEGLEGSDANSELHHEVEAKLDSALTTSMRISKLYDAQALDNTIRAGLLKFYYVKSKGRVEHSTSKQFMKDLADMVRIAGLQHLPPPDLTHTSDSTALESRRTLFYEYLLHDRMAAAVFGRPAKFPNEEITTSPPIASSQSITLLFRTEMATTLLNAREILQKGPSSYDRIESIDRHFTSAWEQVCNVYGGIKEASCSIERRWLTEACLRQTVYCTCRVMMHRLCFFNAPSHFSTESIAKSRRICFEAATMAVETQETLRYTMDSDDLMSSFYVAWIPTEHVITLLLACLMALREAMAIQDSTARSIGIPVEKTIQAAFEMVESAKKLVKRVRRTLRSAPSHCLLAQKGLMTLNRVEGKADAILASEGGIHASIARSTGDSSGAFDHSNGSHLLDAEIPFYASDTANSSERSNQWSTASHGNLSNSIRTSDSGQNLSSIPLQSFSTIQMGTPTHNLDDNEAFLATLGNVDTDAIFWNALQQGTIESSFDYTFDNGNIDSIASAGPPMIIQNTSSSAIEAELESWLAMLK